VLVETMAQYSALMVMKKMFGEDKIRRFLKYELDNYLRSRGGERIEELPLDRVENQPYIHYRKGAVVMYLLQDRLGEDRVNGMLAAIARQIPLQEPALSALDRSGERHAVVRAHAAGARTGARPDGPDHVFDLKAKTATVRTLPDGNFETVLTIDAAKLHANGAGVEKPAALADEIDIGLFDQKPGIGAFAKKDVILMERRPIRSGGQQIRVITARKPGFAGVDPYNKYMDRNSDDNVVPIS
jgi:ABC-2 type transport system permease protein